MTLRERLKNLRRDIGISQGALGSLGFVSTPGWAKIEKGERQPSDALILRFVSWLIKQKHIDTRAAGRLLEELLTLKHLNNRSAFVRRLARNHAENLFEHTAVQLAEDPGVYRPKAMRRSHGGTALDGGDNYLG